MKKKVIFGVLLFALILILFNGKVFARNYSDERYSFTIPNEFEDIYTNVTDTSSYHSFMAPYNDYYNFKEVRFSAYENKYTAPYKQEDLDRNIETIKKSHEESEYTTLKSIKGNLVELNGVKGYKIEYYHTYDANTDLYETVLYELKSDNHQYSIEIRSDVKNYINSAEAKNIIKSFKMKDTVLKSRGIPFVDVATSSWTFDSVKYVYTNNIISGLNDYTFGPNNKLTRGMMATILYNMEGAPKASGTSPFSDVKDSSKWYYKAVLWAAKNGVVSGNKDGTFKPNDYITREQLAIMLYNYATYKGKDVSATNNLSAFTDRTKVAGYALGPVKWAVANSVITGSNKKLNPKGTATRAEAASMIYKYCTKVGK